MSEAVRLYVGGDAATVQGRRCNVVGYRCFTAAHYPRTRFTPDEAAAVVGLLDSGAFSDPPEKRLTPEGALERQLAWEANASRFWAYPWQATALVSYDLLIDEKWTNGVRKRERWSVAEADAAVRVTVDAAAYLSSRRRELAPRQLVLAVQGVDEVQYADCLTGVLAHALPGDVIGLGGWCILGLMRRWLPTFWRTLHCCLPLVAAAGVKDVHIFGVMWPVALGGLVWLADRHGLAISTDSSGPVLRGRYTDPGKRRKAGALADTWEENVELFRRRMADLRTAHHYRRPPTYPRRAVQPLLAFE